MVATFAFCFLKSAKFIPKAKCCGCAAHRNSEANWNSWWDTAIQIDWRHKKARGEKQMQDFSTIFFYYTTVKWNFRICTHKTQGHLHLVPQSSEHVALSKRVHSRLCTYWYFPQTFNVFGLALMKCLPDVLLKLWTSASLNQLLLLCKVAHMWFPLKIWSFFFLVLLLNRLQGII